MNENRPNPRTATPEERITVHLKMKKSLAPSSCRERFVEEIALHLRWKNACSFPTISNRWVIRKHYIFKWMIYGSVRSIGIYFEHLTGGWPM